MFKILGNKFQPLLSRSTKRCFFFLMLSLYSLYTDRWAIGCCMGCFKRYKNHQGVSNLDNTQFLCRDFHRILVTNSFATHQWLVSFETKFAQFKSNNTRIFFNRHFARPLNSSLIDILLALLAPFLSLSKPQFKSNRHFPSIEIRVNT